MLIELSGCATSRLGRACSLTGVNRPLWFSPATPSRLIRSLFLKNMMGRSTTRRGKIEKKKTEEEQTSQNIPGLMPTKQGQSKRKEGGLEGSIFQLSDDDSGTEEVTIQMPQLLSVGKSQNPTGESSAARAKPIHKLDDQAFKPFGPRSRASSDAGSDAAFCRGGPNKPACGEPVRHSDDGVSCDKCDQWFHIDCQDIPKPAYEALKRYQVLSWFCSECKGGLKVDNSKMLIALESKVDHLDRVVKEQLGRMVHCLQEQEKSVDSQTKLIERSIRETVAQKSTYAEMVKGTCSEVVSKVSAKLSSFPQLASANAASKDVQNISRVFDDFLDKDKRKNNLVIHNLPEPDSTSLKERSEKDIRQFQELVKDTFRLNVRVTKSFRVGKAVPNRHRLLIVTLESPDMKHDLLQLAPQLRKSSNWVNIYITPDLTKAEREVARKLRDDLKARRAAGEDNLTIRKGRIVSSSGRQVETSTSNSRPVTAGVEGRQVETAASRNNPVGAGGEGRQVVAAASHNSSVHAEGAEVYCTSASGTSAVESPGASATQAGSDRGDNATSDNIEAHDPQAQHQA